jgi:hypothetical protein
MLPEKRLARSIVEILGQAGVPPSKGVSYYNVGNESLLDALDKHYLDTYLREGGAVFKLVVGDYGSGKSHFLYCVRDRAWERNFAVSKVDLSPKESPYDDQKRVYAAVASSIVWHEVDMTNGEERGLVRFLEGTLRRLVERVGLDLDDPAAFELADVQALLETVANTPIDSLSFQKAILGYCSARLQQKDKRLESLTRWLHGDEVTPEDMRDLRTFGVTEKINKSNAFKVLRSLCQTVRAIGYSGLVLLFDEGDRMLSIGGKSEKTATDNLREVIDRCREDLPGAMFMYAVPPDFIKSVVPKYQALDQRIRSPQYFSRSNPFSPQINLDHLDIPDGELLVQIGHRLQPIFEVAFDLKLDAGIQAQNIKALSEAARRAYLDMSHRRLFIKALVAEWYKQTEEGEQAISADYADGLIRGEYQKFNVQADESQTPY